ncbi:PhoPQ-activated protein PqaA family protein [Pantoea sp. A4]|uniref:PhoPQ-activated protein PqaA family protein n=1 Tax=Pantoea sp. A4 TaxID=1225184 RepID=UPI0003750F00|nr:PhoPQ-activated protein PqaA family protein [Pantoea sp. A4]
MKALLLIITSLAAAGLYAQPAMSSECNAPSDVISCYRQSLAERPLDYVMVSKETLRDQPPQKEGAQPVSAKELEAQPHVDVTRYRLMSQSWSPDGLVTPMAWQHDVNIYIPPNPRGDLALIAVDLDERTNAETAYYSHTIVVSLNNVPSVDLTYQGDKAPREEDDSIARSWQLYMDKPALRARLPLHVPMAAAISQTIRLAKAELKQQHIDKFVVTGASKRGWATWLAGISDPAVVAIVPFVADVLNTQKMVQHMYQTYGGNWPIAFGPYYQNHTDMEYKTAHFAELMKIEDPMQYMGTDQQQRLAIPKYIVNASGDDFFPPDNAKFYYNALPGVKSLRMAPNSDHIGINRFFRSSLVTFLDRLQEKRPLPVINESLEQQSTSKLLRLSFSEKPVRIEVWRAVNPTARDFRLACGIRYGSSALVVPADNKVDVSLAYYGSGWQAMFVEATFDDGYVATSQVYITPDDRYPTVAPMSQGGACTTLPGRSNSAS